MLTRIGGRPVGPGAPLFTIAEIGLNHGGSRDEAIRLARAAAASGASAIKLQTLRADRLVAQHCPAPAHVQAESLRDFFRQFELSEEAHAAVAAEARALGLVLMSTPFDEGSVARTRRCRRLQDCEWRHHARWPDSSRRRDRPADGAVDGHELAR